MWPEAMREGDPGRKLLTRSAAKASRRAGTEALGALLALTDAGEKNE
jgi:hypothetical protein